MSTIRVALSGLSPGLALLQPLLPTLRQAFQPFGINLQFVDGTVLQADPDDNNGWPDLITALVRQSRGGSPAHLVITNTPYNNDGTIDGRLCDPSTRGVVAVYLGAHLYYEGGGGGPHRRPDLVSAVCIHELGHLFNLTHDMADQSTYASAMSQATLRRLQAPAAAWQGAANEAADSGEPAVQPPNPVRSYPFNGACRHELRQASNDRRRQPFGGPFSGGEGGAGADISAPLSLSVRLHEDRPEVYVGGPLYLTLAITNPGADPQELPLNLGPAFESMKLVIIDPDGAETSHHARDAFCSGARRRLAPGQRVLHSLSFTGQNHPALFQRPGPHVCRVELVDPSVQPRVRLGWAEVKVSAEIEPSAAAASTALRSMLDRRAKGVGKGVAPENAPSSIVTHWDLASGMRLRRGGRRRAEHLARCQASDAPLAISHEASRQLMLDGLYRGGNAGDLLQALRDRFPDQVHDELHDAARRSAESFALRKIREIDR